MQSTFSMEKFSRFAVGFRRKVQDASRARIFSWSGVGGGFHPNNQATSWPNLHAQDK